jgi:oligoribonuclease NrnB/cAMP/cGMP phosphodiesterase (DHH superfamily)
MQVNKCKQCGTSIEIPLDYAAPFIKCPECGSHERAPVQAVKPRLSVGKLNVNQEALNLKDSMSEEILNNSKYYEDTLGSEGLNEVYSLVAQYMLEQNLANRRLLKSKAMQQVMRKYKVAAALVSQAIDYAEKSPKTQEIIAVKFQKKLMLRNVAIAFVIAIVIGLVLTLL